MNNVTIARAYYTALNEKDLSAVEQLLYPEIHLISPLTDITGKTAVLNAVSRYMTILKKLTVRTACATEDQVLLVYDYEVNIPEQQDMLHAAVLMHFEDNLIHRIELFFDARPFAQ